MRLPVLLLFRILYFLEVQCIPNRYSFWLWNTTIYCALQRHNGGSPCPQRATVTNTRTDMVLLKTFLSYSAHTISQHVYGISIYLCVIGHGMIYCVQSRHATLLHNKGSQLILSWIFHRCRCKWYCYVVVYAPIIYVLCHNKATTSSN